MRDWISLLLEAKQRRETAVAITVASTKGSAPREAGTKMIVTTGEVNGTIGGGHLEFKAIEIARDLIAADGPRALHRFALGATLGQCCGGVVNLLFEPVLADADWVETVAARTAVEQECVVVTPVSGDVRSGKLILDIIDGKCVVATGTLGSSSLDEEAKVAAQAMLRRSQSTLLKTCAGDRSAQAVEYFFDHIRAIDFHVVLFGAGHVGRALVNVMSGMACSIDWIDSREDEFPASLPDNVNCICTDAPESEVMRARPGSYFLVMTHSHALDQALCEHILRRDDFAYFGLIGSQTKRRQFERRMSARAVSSAQLAKMTCPIGEAGIVGKEPATIAIAVAAQMLRRRSERQLAAGASASAFTS
jgi:xanthine dehydrogenase accessory factor